MVPNSCGNEVFRVSEWEFLKRYLMLGSEKGTYYISENKLIEQHIESLEKILVDPSKHEKLINIIKEHIDQVYKKDYLLNVMARCCAEKKAPELRKVVYSLLQKTCMIPTNLFMFIAAYEKIHMNLHKSTGWNKLQKKTIANWYNDKDSKHLIYLLTKYKNREGWTHTDVLRLCHAKNPDSTHDQIYKYVTKGYDDYLLKDNKDENILKYISAYEKLKITTEPIEAIKIIKENGFVREHVPTDLLNNTDVWNELSQNIPMVAMLRNLNKMTSVGVFEKYPETLNKLIDRLTSEETVQKSKVHPLQILISLKMYSRGHGMKGGLSWEPIPKLIAALNVAFKSSFKNVEPTGKKYLLALDVSGSMTGATVCGIDCMMASEVSCALAMVIASVETNCDIMAFSHTFRKLDLNPNDSLENNLKKTYDSNFGGTDCSLPMTWSMDNNKKYDAIIVFTDSETNCNKVTPSSALKSYRKQSGTDCKLIVIGMASNNFTLADPEDPFGMLDIAGFSADTPNVINKFLTHEMEVVEQPINVIPEASSDTASDVGTDITSDSESNNNEKKIEQDIIDYYEVAKYVDERKNDEYYYMKLPAKKRLLKYYHNKLTSTPRCANLEYANKIHDAYMI